MDAGADTLQKALQINLDPRWYGTIAEIGAGQEVARWFFRAGGAAGTVAKSDVGLRHGGQRRGLRQGRPLRLRWAGCRRCSTTSTSSTSTGSATSAATTTAFFAFADTVVGAQLPRRQRVPRLDGREVPVAPARRGQPDRPARADARRRGGAAAGGARHRRRQPAARRVLPAPRAGAAGREPARPADHRPHRDRHDRAHGHRVPGGRQPADGAQARAARPERRGDVRPRPARCCSRARCCARRRSWSSAAASGRPPSSTSTCSRRRGRSSRPTRRSPSARSSCSPS